MEVHTRTGFHVHKQSMVLFGAFNPFTLKVIINRYVPTTIFLIVMGLFFQAIFFSHVFHLKEKKRGVNDLDGVFPLTSVV